MMRHEDIELDSIGFFNQAFDPETLSIRPDTETAEHRSQLLCKRPRKEKVVLRKGPAPLEDVDLSALQRMSCYPGKLDDQMSIEGSNNKHKETTDDKDCEVSTAGSRGLLIYFAKLASSPEDEKIDVEFIDSLLRGGADINVTDRYGQTIMHEVVREWHTNVAQFCIERGADIDKADAYGRTPLHLAAAVNYPEMIHWLVKNGADLQKKTKGEMQAPVHYAAKCNAIDSLKALLELDANILERDYKQRMPLFVAAESGRAEACRYLLDCGAPAGIYNDCGVSALSFMIEKMPDVATEALGQFVEVDNALRRRSFHLNYLEIEYWKELARRSGKPLRQTYARPALQVIVLYNELNIIMHPVIQRLIRMKWDLFGKRNAVLYLLLNFLYTVIWTVICITVPRDQSKPFYSPIKKNIWRVIIDFIGCIMTLFFIIKQIIDYHKSQSVERLYEQWKIREIERDLQYCHPQWPEERRFLCSEIDLVKSKTEFYFSDPWNVFEWVTYAGILLIMSSRAGAVLVNSKVADEIHHRSVAIVLILIWLRLMKYCRSFHLLGPFITMLGHVILATLKFAFLYFEIFIPYCCAFWILFGEKSGTEFMYFNDLVYQVFLMTLVADYKFFELSAQDKLMAQLLVGSYLAISSVVCLNLYIALMSDTFTRVWSKATANAYMSQALEMLDMEKKLGDRNKDKVRKFLLEHCSPQIVHESTETDDFYSNTEIVNSLAIKMESLNKSAHENAEHIASMLQSVNKLRSELTEFQESQVYATSEILKLAKDSSKWEIRNIIKSVPESLGERLKRSFTKDSEIEDFIVSKDEEEKDTKKGSQFWKWTSGK